MFNVSFLWVAPPHAAAALPVDQGFLITEVHDDTQTHSHSVWLLCTSDQPVTGTSAWQHTQHSQQTEIHDAGGIRTHNPSKQ